MAEEEKKVAEATKEPKVLYSYKITRYDDGRYDIEGLPLDGKETSTPSIDKYNASKDLIALAPKLDHQLVFEEATQFVLQQLQNLATQSEKK